MIFGLHFTEADFDAVCDRFLAAALQMRADGWWWHDPSVSAGAVQREVLAEMLQQRLPAWVRARIGAES